MGSYTLRARHSVNKDHQPTGTIHEHGLRIRCTLEVPDDAHAALAFALLRKIEQTPVKRPIVFMIGDISGKGGELISFSIYAKFRGLTPRRTAGLKREIKDAIRAFQLRLEKYLEVTRPQPSFELILD